LEEPFDAVFGAIFDDYTETAYRTDWSQGFQNIC
jgi:hypothetical protein